ncbi:hypothetical protein Taro_020085 [Colocasia esculenta]|uniref:Uncharacterized protein n=1 Tax=Colocasia esculenta TaxID=4460 RepID=A0A843UMQ9_COLES|nr:hypothetical protein [Colocasia esculenta]
MAMTGGVSALVTLMERIAHEVDILPSVVVRRLFRNASLVGYPRFFVSQARVFVVLGVYLGTCVVPSRSVSSVLDTLTPVFELYVRMRERRQWDSDFPELGAPARDPRGARHGPAAVCLQVFTCVVRLGGPPDWAQSAHRFSACERDRGMHRVLNATALGVTFLLLLLSGRRLHARHTSRIRRPADVGIEKATAAYVAFRLRRRATSRSQLQCIFKEPWLNRASTGSARPGGAAAGFLRAIRGPGDVWGVFSPRGRCVEREKRRVILGFCVLHKGREFYLVLWFRLYVAPV